MGLARDEILRLKDPPLEACLRFWESQYRREDCDLSAAEVHKRCRATGFKGGTILTDHGIRTLAERIDQRRLEIGSEDRPLPYGNWKPIERLGAGGCGEVWLAKHRQLGLRVFKYYRPNSQLDSLTSLRNELQKFKVLREAGGHPGIVPVLEDLLDRKPQDRPFLEYEYREGVDLEKILVRRLDVGEYYSPVEAAEIMLNLCGIMGFAHDQGIIHRDLKPANILLSAEGGHNGFSILDFGISGCLTPVSERSKNDSTTCGLDFLLAGSGPYMSPEQAQCDRSRQDDVWALGVIWLQLLTGRYCALLRGDQTPVPFSLLFSTTNSPALITDYVLTYLTDVPLTEEQLVVLLSCFEATEERFGDANVLGAAIRKAFGGTIVEHYRQQAAAAMTAESHREAIDSCERALDFDPNNAAIHVNLAEAWKQIDLDSLMGDYEEDYGGDDEKYEEAQTAAENEQADKVIANYNKAIALDPGNASYHKLLADYCDDISRDDEALVNYKKAVALAPNEASYYEGLIDREFLLCHDHEVIAYCQKRIAIDPTNASYHESLAHKYAYMGRCDEAIAAYQKAIALDSGIASYYTSLGDAYLQAVRYEEAIASYQKAIEIDGTNAQYHKRLCEAYLEAGHGEEAITRYKKAISLDPQLGEWAMRVRVYRSANRFHVLIAECEDRCEAERSLGGAHAASGYYWLGEAYSEARCYEKAIVSYRRALDIESDNVLYLRKVAEAYLRLGRCDDAVATYRKAVALEPKNQDLPYGFGLICLEMGRYEEAIQAFERVVELDPLGVDDGSVGRVYDLAGKHEEAVGILRRVVMAGGGDWASLWLGQSLYGMGEFKEAVIHLSNTPQETLIHDGRRLFWLACGHYRCGDVNEAIRRLKRAFPRTGKVHWLQIPPGLKCNPLLDTDAETMIRFVEEMHEHNPGNAEILYRLGLVYHYARRPEDACKAFDKAMALSPCEEYLDWQQRAYRKLKWKQV